MPLSSTTEGLADQEAKENNLESLNREHYAQTLSSRKEPTPSPTLHLLVCAASSIPSADLATVLSRLHPFSDSQTQPTIRTISVPLLPPTSDEQAALWSREYWPTVYKRNNPFGPHPSLVSRAEAEISPQVDAYMALARRVGTEVHVMALGEAFGAVIVDRTAGVEPIVLVVAGDGRWSGCGRDEKGGRGNGNVMAHAVMRAIGMVARKRREVAVSVVREGLGTAKSGKRSAELPDDDDDDDDVFVDRPICDLEESYFMQSPIAPYGYLCLDLEIYVSHEPCVMCSMAINHSRFGRVVFGKRMPRSGGLTSELTVPPEANPAEGVEEEGVSNDGRCEHGLGYGLFWRPGLNWKLLAWEWVGEDGDEAEEVREDVHL